MEKDKEQHLIEECPVCHSHDIKQNITYAADMLYPSGSYCKLCGVQFHYNSSHVKQDMEQEKKLLTQAMREAKEKIDAEKNSSRRN